MQERINKLMMEIGRMQEDLDHAYDLNVVFTLWFATHPEAVKELASWLASSRFKELCLGIYEEVPKNALKMASEALRCIEVEKSMVADYDAEEFDKAFGTDAG